ncbi:MAG: PQQ-binding-like beta-propeller repeat protein [Planctomycetales bacterium]|nr:PQQ-binding-like beta-propeller repeat protein [Planctomycetales bacterium]
MSVDDVSADETPAKPADAAPPAEAAPDVKPLVAPKPAPAKAAAAPAGGAVIQVQANGGGQVIIQGNVQVGGRVMVNGANAFAVAAESDQAEETVFRDPPRPLLQRFKRSESLIEEKRFAEAVEELGAILEEPEDYSYDFDTEGAGEGSTRRSLKGEAQRRIGALPAEGREAYELQYGTRAQQLLDRSIAEGDDAGLAEVSRRYFHTKAGYQATYLVGIQHLEHDRPLAAALSLRRLKDVPTIAADYEPELSLKLAVSWARAGADPTSATVLEQAKKQYPSAEFTVEGAPLRWYGAGERPQSWLASHMLRRGAAAIADALPAQWALFRGDAARNAIGAGGSPLLNRRWAVPFANHPDLEKLVEHLRRSYGEREVPALPSVQPLAVNDVVLMRTLTGLAAVDFRTGKRVWRGAADEFAEELLMRDSPLARVRADQEPNQLMMLVDERLWRDAAYGTFSSDGRAAFCVESTSNIQQDNNVHRMVIMAGGRRVMNGGQGFVATNRLAAYELASEGKLLWEVGGASPIEDPALADTFFLGPPLPLGERLYVLAESKGEIRLIVLDSKSGKLEWTQQLALANDAVGTDLRHTSGLSPSYSDGVLLCPTSLGAIVAVDVNDRSLLWGFQYPRQGNRYNQNFMVWNLNNRNGVPTEMNRWQDATITLADGRAYLAPPESDKLFCVNLIDGELLWKQERGQGLYIGSVADGRAIVVASNELRAYNAVDGKQLWTLALPEGAAPSGRGFFNGKQYFVPLSTAEVAAVDPAAGRYISRSKSRSGSIPGNLICYRGAVISQGTGGLECFFQIEDLRRDVKDKLAAKPGDAAALASSGEILLDEGKIEEAIKTLRESFRKQADPRTRNIFVDALLEGLDGGLATTDTDLADLEALALGTEKEELYLRRRALAHEKAGQWRAALAQYLRLVDAADLAEEPVRSAAAAVSIRRELWVRTRLDALGKAGGVELSQALDKEIESRRAKALESNDVAAMRRFLDFFGDHRAADELRFGLAKRLIDEGSLLEAENLLRRVADAGAGPAALDARGTLASLLVKHGRGGEAEPYLRRLEQSSADIKDAQGRTGADLFAELTKNGEAKFTAPLHAWPTGKVEVEETRQQTGMTFRPFPLEFRGDRGPVFRDLVIEMDQPQQALVALDKYGAERWRISLSEPSRRGVNQYNPIVSHVRADGHLLIVSLGHELVAIDTLGNGAKGSGRILWRQDLTESFPGLSANVIQQVHLRNVQMNWGVQRFFAQTPDGTPIGMTGPATLRYVSFLKRRALHVVDPLTGKPLWIRHDIDPGSEIYGDEQYIFVALPNSDRTLVLRASDGEQLKTVKLPKPEERVMSFGRRLLSWRYEGRHAHLSLHDMFDEKVLWTHELSSGSRLWPISADEVGVMDRKGSFKVVAVTDGVFRLEADVQPEPQLSEAYVFRYADTYVLLTNSPYRQRDGVNIQPVQGGYNNPLINGYMYGFDGGTKKQLYKTRIEGHGLTLYQPEAVPMLVFASQIYETPRNGQIRSPQGVVLAIDKRDGRTLYDKRQSTPINLVDVTGEPQRNSVSLRTMRNTLRFTFTDEPNTEASKPPQPTDVGKTNEGSAGEIGKAIVGGAAELGKALQQAQEAARQEAERRKAAGGAEKQDEKPAEKPKE